MLTAVKEILSCILALAPEALPKNLLIAATPDRILPLAKNAERLPEYIPQVDNLEASAALSEHQQQALANASYHAKAADKTAVTVRKKTTESTFVNFRS